MKRGLTFTITVITAIITVLLYFTPDISPEHYWYMAFLPFLIPIFWLINIILFFIWVFRRSWWRMLIPVLALAVGYKYLNRTYAWNFFTDKKPQSLELLSYNVRVFNSYDHLVDKDLASTKNMIAWLKNSKADVLCLQEFLNYNNQQEFRSIKQLSENFPHYYVNPFYVSRDSNALIGMAIFSKHPIIGKGAIKFREKTNNQVIYADVKIGNDTVRVYSAHLQSMSIDDQELVNSTLDSSYKNKLVKAFVKYKRGAILRSRQVERVLDHMNSSPYRVMISGDFNETPYTYSYEQIRDRLNNAFEEAGSGFGFSYNGPLFFLRIDNIFVDKGIHVNEFKVHRDIKWSDHFPQSASLTLK